MKNDNNNNKNPNSVASSMDRLKKAHSLIGARALKEFWFLEVWSFPMKGLELSVPRLLCAQSMVHLRYPLCNIA